MLFFPDLVWKSETPTELPSKSFLLDRQSLKNIENALLQIFKEANSVHRFGQNPSNMPFSKSLLHLLSLLAP
jgi:hypothetical protein